MKMRDCFFTVRGRTPFPVDMLRYDSCYPNDTASASDIEASLNPDLSAATLAGRSDRQFIVNLSAAHLPLGPADRRWASFGWHVTMVNDMDARRYYGREAA